MKALVLLAVAAATAVVLWVSAAGAAQNSSGGPLAKGVAVTKGHIPLSKTSGTLPRSLKGVPSKGNYAFLLKLKAEPTGMAYNAFRYAGKSAASTAAKNQLATVHTAQRNVVSALPSGSHVLYETHAALAGVAVYTKVANLAALQRISGVEKIYPIAPKTPSNSYAVHLQKAPQVWQTYGDTGANSTVAIIDTGIDYTHADFGGPGTVNAYNTALANDTADPTYPDPSKVIGGHDFAGDDYDADPQDPGFDPTPAPDNNPLDCNSHGTHVAGIIAGYGENTGRLHVHGWLQRARRTRRRHLPVAVQDRARDGSGREDHLLQGLRLRGQHRRGRRGARPRGRPEQRRQHGRSRRRGQHVARLRLRLVAGRRLGPLERRLGTRDQRRRGGRQRRRPLRHRRIARRRHARHRRGRERRRLQPDRHAARHRQRHRHTTYGAQRSVAYDWANDPDISGSVVEITDATDVNNATRTAAIRSTRT